MIKKTVHYDDFDGNPVEEDLYFHYTKAELMELVQDGEGKDLRERLSAIVASGNNSEAFAEMKLIIGGAYGRKSVDGRRFIKDAEATAAFMTSDVFSELILSLMEDGSVAEFIAGMLPFSSEKRAEVLSGVEDARPVVNIVSAPSSPADLNSMSREELLLELKARSISN